MSDRTIRAGIRDLLSSGDIGAVPPDMAQALAEFLGAHGYYSVDPVIRELTGVTFGRALETERAFREQLLSPVPWQRRARPFVAFARAWAGVLMARDLLEGEEPTSEEMLTMTGVVRPGDVENLQVAMHG